MIGLFDSMSTCIYTSKEKKELHLKQPEFDEVS